MRGGKLHQNSYLIYWVYLIYLLLMESQIYCIGILVEEDARRKVASKFIFDILGIFDISVVNGKSNILHWHLGGRGCEGESCIKPLWQLSPANIFDIFVINGVLDSSLMG